MLFSSEGNATQPAGAQRPSDFAAPRPGRADGQHSQILLGALAPFATAGGLVQKGTLNRAITVLGPIEIRWRI
jgi:hypothetical protein